VKHGDSRYFFSFFNIVVYASKGIANIIIVSYMTWLV